ncbi:MAG: metallophosphoesterase [Clostridia bacterium]|nr:metallophosphoesterase [Clostridia bacterium]
MSVFAIGDLHLSLTTEKPMDIFGDGWTNHIERVLEGFSCVGDEDLTVLAGDISWGISLSESLEDFKFIDRLPGKKLLLKGNHDYWWETVSKTKRFFAENGIETIEILHNNAFLHGDIAVCGTRGWFAPEEGDDPHAEKIYNREVGRLKMSLDAAKALNPREIYCFLHYPPISKGYECAEITEMLQKYGVSCCCYGHLHGYGHGIRFEGEHKNVNYRLISADFLKFVPIKI